MSPRLSLEWMKISLNSLCGDDPPNVFSKRNLVIYYFFTALVCYLSFGLSACSICQAAAGTGTNSARGSAQDLTSDKLPNNYPSTLPNQKLTIEGKVLDSYGKSLGRVWIGFIPVNTGTNEEQWSYTQTDGSFTNSGLELGDWKVCFKIGDLTLWYGATLDPKKGEILTIQGTGPFYFLFKVNIGHISIEVLDQKGGAFFSCETVVTLFDVNSPQRYESGSSHYTFIVPTLTYYQLYFTPGKVNNEYASEWYNHSPGRTGASVLFLDKNKPIENLIVYLNPAGSISGKLLNPNLGQNAVRINVYDYHGDFIQYVFNDQLGCYKFACLAPGLYRLFYDTANSPTYMPMWYDDGTDFESAQDIQVNPGEKLENIDITLKRYSQISGRVTGPYGNTLSGVSVSMFDRRFSCVRKVTTDNSGHYYFDRIIPGEYQVYFNEYGVGSYCRQWYSQQTDRELADWVTVAENQIVTGIDAQLPVGGTLHGRVLTSDGKFMVKVVIELFTDGLLAVAGSTDINGEYTLSGIPAGNYQVVFTPPPGNLSQWYHAKPTSNESDSVTITAGRTVSLLDTVIGPCYTPAIPELIAPIQVVSNSQYQVQWIANASGYSYQLQEAIDPEFSNPLTIECTGLQIDLSHTVQWTRVFYYRVRASHDSSIGRCFSPWSAVRSTIVWVEGDLGDVNHDGKIDRLDVRSLAQHLALNTSLPGQLDLNRDGQVDVTDLVRLINIVSGNIQ